MSSSMVPRTSCTFFFGINPGQLTKVQNLDQFTVASPPTDAISALKFSTEPDSTRIVVSSWDKNVYLYDLRDENGAVGTGKLLQKFEHRAPVLDVCFGANEDEIITAGLDWDVRR